MVKDAWGVRRSCAACAAKFYDLQKTPPVCPKCGSVYEMIITGRGRKSKTAALAAGRVDVIDDLDLVEDLDLDPTLGDDADVLDADADADEGLGINERVLEGDEAL